MIVNQFPSGWFNVHLSYNMCVGCPSLLNFIATWPFVIVLFPDSHRSHNADPGEPLQHSTSSTPLFRPSHHSGSSFFVSQADGFCPRLLTQADSPSLSTASPLLTLSPLHRSQHSTARAQECPWPVFPFPTDQKQQQKGEKMRAHRGGFKSQCSASVAGRAGCGIGGKPKEKRWGRTSDTTGVLWVHDPSLFHCWAPVWFQQTDIPEL